MMDKKLKWLSAVSISVLMATGCTTAPAPWAKQNGTTANQPPKAGVNHYHGTKSHPHPLPSSGLSHTHSQGGPIGTLQPQQQPTYQQQPVPTTPAPGSYTSGYYDYQGYGTGQNSNYGSSSSSTKYTGASGYDYGSSSRDSSYYGSGYDRPADGGYSQDDPVSVGNTGQADPNYRKGDAYYTVQRGNTVFEVSRQTGMNWEEIVRLNDIRAPKYEIYPGQRLKVR